MAIIELIASSNFIAVNKTLAKKIGLEESILLGELASEYTYWQRQGQLQDGYFFSTIENIEENTTLNRYRQDKAMKTLKELELVNVVLKGIPAKRYITINEKKLKELLDNNDAEDEQASLSNIDNLDSEISASNNNTNKNNNKNNIKKERKKKTEYDVIIDEMVDNEEIKDLIYEHIKMRKMKKKPVTDKALKMLINKLYSLSNDIEEQKEIIEQSIINCWDSFYQLKKEANNNGRTKKYTASIDYDQFIDN